MSNTIQIKRGNGAPSTLQDGELGFSKDKKKLYIGNNNEVEPIGIQNLQDGVGANSVEQISAEAIGKDSFAEGKETVAKGNNSHAEGGREKAPTDYEGGYTPGAPLEYYTPRTIPPEISGEKETITVVGGYAGLQAHSENVQNAAIAPGSHAEGKQNVVATRYSHIEGQTNTIAASNSSGMAHVEGYNNTITASGLANHVEGTNNSIEGNIRITASHVEGLGNICLYSHQHIGGTHAKAENHPYILGIGNSKNPRNGFYVNYNGQGYFSGGLGTPGADYAEFFEWEDGNLQSEDRVGLAVTLSGDKIRKAQKDDDIIGIVSGEPMMIGDFADDEWKNKYVKDRFGRTIYQVEKEYITAENPDTGEVQKFETEERKFPQLNPAYDSTQNYISRQDRAEWDTIGLIGKLYAIDDGSCQVNHYAKSDSNGILTYSKEKTNIRVMKRLDKDLVLILLK